jgi:hypothetical protein
MIFTDNHNSLNAGYLHSVDVLHIYNQVKFILTQIRWPSPSLRSGDLHLHSDQVTFTFTQIRWPSPSLRSGDLRLNSVQRWRSPQLGSGDVHLNSDKVTSNTTQIRWLPPLKVFQVLFKSHKNQKCFFWYFAVLIDFQTGKTFILLRFLFKAF